MSAAAPPRRRSPFEAIVRYTLRVCTPEHRVLLVLPFAGAVLFGLLSRIPNDPATVSFARVGGSAMHTLILPSPAWWWATPCWAPRSAPGCSPSAG